MLDKIKKILNFEKPTEEQPKRPLVVHEPVDELPPVFWLEKEINQWLKRELSRPNRKDKSATSFIRYIFVEFEPEQVVKLIVMTRYYIQFRIDGELADFWHDHKISSVVLRIKEIKLSKIPLLPQFISEKISYIFLQLFGFLFNPIQLQDGIYLRCYGDVLHFDLQRYFLEEQGKKSLWRKYLLDRTGNRICRFFISGAVTSKGAIKPIVHRLSEHGETRAATGMVAAEPVKESKNLLNSADLWQLLAVAAIVSFAVTQLRPFLYIDYGAFSFSRTFISSLVSFAFSIFLISLARIIYSSWLTLRSEYRDLAFKIEDTKYKIERLRRDIELEMGVLFQKTDSEDFEKTLFMASRHRYRAFIMEKKLEIARRHIKIKYGLAYLVTVVSELLSLYYL